MNDTHDTLAPDAPNLTALALGEITDPAEAKSLRDAIAASPALRQEYNDIAALAGNLRQEYQAELGRQPSASNAAHKAQHSKTLSSPGGPALRKRHWHQPDGFHGRTGMGAMPPRKSASPGIVEKIIRFAVFGGAGLSTAALLFMLLRTEDRQPRQWKLSENTTQTAEAPANRPGEFAVRLPGQQFERESAHAHSPRPSTRSSNTADPSATQDNAFANLVAQMPVHTSGNGDNSFVATSTRHSAPLCIGTTGRDYAQRLHELMAQGRPPEQKLVRIDGLVNSLLASPASMHLAQPASRGNIRLETDVVRTPWASGRWIVRASIFTGNAGGDAIVGRNAHASLIFQPGKVASWRILGHEDGPPQAPTLGTPAQLPAGKMFTTLIEITPVASSMRAEEIGEIALNFEAPDGHSVTLSKRVFAPRDDSTTPISDDTRLALAAASLGLALRHSPYRGTASLALSGQLTAQVRNPEGKRLLEAILRSAPADA